MTTGSSYSQTGGPRGDRGTGRPGGFRRFGRGRKACTFCVEKVKTIDYKSVNRLRRYLSDRARIESGKRTGTCARHQRILRLAIKRARFMALLPYAADHLRVTGPVSVGPRGVAAPGVPGDMTEPVEPEIGPEGDESESSGEDVQQTVGDERA
jgi:small subunit ribosomal protein S18